MRVSIAVPGRLSHPGAIAYADDLYQRISRILPVERLTAREARRGKGGLDASARNKESASLQAIVPSGATAVALDLSGKSMDSDRFFAWLVAHAEQGTREICFLIGGPDGLEPSLRASCREAVSLSPMVLPHELAEVVLLEQVYRALTRWKGLPYHR
jgi:23S rRNA (pseudouridine1915-N3)-methyltransferase